jgi:diaminopimelate epimerase
MCLSSLSMMCCAQGCSHEMRIVNADGTEAQMCGNGIRCLAQHLVTSGCISLYTEIHIHTRAGKITATVMEG